MLQSDKNWRIVEDLDLNLEQQKNLDTADKEIEIQKQKIAEMEDSIKRVQDEKHQIEDEMTGLDQEHFQVTSEVEQDSMMWLGHLGNREALRNRESKYCENLLLLVNAEHQYRKFFQAKQMMLTDIFKNTENLLINMDKTVV